MSESIIEIPYGDVVKNPDGTYEFEFITDNFELFSPDIAMDVEIDSWFIDNNYEILERKLCFNDPIANTINYIFYNPEIDDYEEVEVTSEYSGDVEWGNFVLKYKLKK